MMKNKLKIILLVCFPILIQCNTEKEDDSHHVESEISSKIVKNMLLKDYNDIIEIISLKYDLDTNITNNIVTLYFIETDIFYRMMQAKESNDQININELYNKKFPITTFSDSIVRKFKNIDREKLGQILFDIELLKQLKDINTKIE